LEVVAHERDHLAAEYLTRLESITEQDLFGADPV
jgi:hypothetical protein